MFCTLTINGVKRVKTYEIMNIELIEVQFDERNFYQGGGYRRILYLDGSAKLDGSQLLDGWRR